MKTIALFGAGGKMGLRATDNLKDSEYDMRYVEVSERGIEALEKRGISVTPKNEALLGTDVVIMAVPDILIGRILRDIVPKLNFGTLVITLDPAAPCADELPARKDISYFVTHPCHPSVFNYESDPEASRDYFGGVKAKQSIVCALVQGSEADYLSGEEIATRMFAPVEKSYRITIEQMVMLEPALAETLSATCLWLIRKGMEHVVNCGVPAEAARAFLLGHIKIALAILFGELDAQFSDGCKKAMGRARRIIFKEDWMKIFEKENIMREVEAIVKETERN